MLKFQVLIPYHQRGQVTYRKNRWRMSGGGFLQNYMRLFGQEGIGRPELEADAEITSIKKLFTKELNEEEIPEINAALVFTTDGVEFEVEEAPMPALPLKKLKDFMRDRAKDKPITAQELDRVKAILPE